MLSLNDWETDGVAAESKLAPEAGKHQNQSDFEDIQ